MSIPLINRSGTTDAERLNAFMKVSAFHREVFPKHADSRSPCTDIAEYIARFNVEFYEKSKREDSNEKKELNDYWDYDRTCMGFSFGFSFWLPRFRATMDQASPTSLHR
jgi:hypothetical protein